MKYRKRTYYNEKLKSLMRDRRQQGKADNQPEASRIE